MEALTQPQFRELTPEDINGKILTNPIFTETITVTNPYNHTTWKEAVIPPELGISKDTVIIITNGIQMRVSKFWAGCLRSQGAYAPGELDFLDKD